jgi:pseudomonalisin
VTVIIVAKGVVVRGAKFVAVITLLLCQGVVYAQTAAPAAWSTTRTRAHPVGSATLQSYLGSNESVEIVVALKTRNQDALRSLVTSLLTPGDPQYRHWQSHETIMNNFAPTAAQARAVAEFLTDAGFANVGIEAGNFTVRASGTAAIIRRSFNTQLAHFKTEDGRDVIANTQDVQVPTALADMVEAVLGLQTLDGLKTMTVQQINPLNWPAIYDAQNLPTASNTVVGVVTAGLMTQTLIDLSTFESMDYLPPLTPTVVYVGGTPTTSGNADAEWDMDTQDILAMAGGNLGGLMLYAGPSAFDTLAMFDSSLASVIGKVVSDNEAKVVSISMGECETTPYSDGTMAAVDNLFAQAVAQGQTFVIASGDHGSRMCGTLGNNGTWGTVLGDSYPASSPYVVAAGGTTLSTGTGGASYVGETGWSYSGGGPSLYEPMPSWQVGIVPGTMRGVPDVAFDGDFTSSPNSEVLYILDTTQTANAGTSLAAPLFAGAWARLESATGNQLGFAGAILYSRSKVSTAMFHDITSGSNDDYSAGVGWDYVTGFGSLDVGKTYQEVTAPMWLPPVLQILNIL